MRREFEKTIRDLQSIEILLNEIGNTRQAKLVYMIAKNKSIIKISMDAFHNALKPSVEAISYEKEREKLLIEHAKKDSKGNAIRIPIPNVHNMWQFVLENEAKYIEELEILREEHSEGVKDIEEIENVRKQLLAESEEISLYCINIDDLKEDSDGNLPISAIHLSSLISFGLVVDDNVVDIKDKKLKRGS